jgi:type I restriction enzyme, S subunit
VIPAALLEQFDVMAEAPGGVQRLRELILQLAVRGQLVPQDETEGMASLLLDQVRGEQRELAASGEIPQPLPVTPRAEDTAPFRLPPTWTWARLGELVAVLDFRRRPVREADRVIRTTGKSPDELFPYYGATQQQGWIDDFLFDEETVLLGEDGAPFFRKGKNVAYVARGRYWVNNHAHVLRGLAGVSNRYLCHALNVADYQGFVSGTTRPKLTQGKMVELLVPVPPALEQRRIVAKVDQLMALCDELEARQQRRAEARVRANRAVLLQLTAATDDAELATAWERLHKSFDMLYDAPEAVAEIRRALVDLAVLGRLCAQDPSDEPASALLPRAASVGQPARSLPAPAEESIAGDPNPADPPVAVPPGWLRARAGDLLSFITSGSRGWAKYYSEEGSIFLRIGNLDYDTVALDLSSIQRVAPPDGAEGLRTRVQPGDVLVSITGDTGMVGLVPPHFPEAYINQHIALARPWYTSCSEWMAWFFTSSIAREHLFGAQRGIKNSLGLDDVASIPVLLPPLAEQRRIISRLQRLMKLCDEIEAGLALARERATHLAVSVVHRLTAA